MKEEMELGVQPLDAIMTRLKLANSDVIGKSTEQLTFKMLTKGRKGRKITYNVKNKILLALNACLPEGEKPFILKDLFNYDSK